MVAEANTCALLSLRHIHSHASHTHTQRGVPLPLHYSYTVPHTHTQPHDTHTLYTHNAIIRLPQYHTIATHISCHCLISVRYHCQCHVYIRHITRHGTNITSLTRLITHTPPATCRQRALPHTHSFIVDVYRHASLLLPRHGHTHTHISATQ